MKELNIETIYDVICRLEESEPNQTAFNFYENDSWHSISTEHFLYDLKRMTYGLVALGLQRGDKVGILASPSPSWSMVDFAIAMAGGISVPLFPNISDENFVYEVAQANVRILFVDGEEQWEMFDRHRYLFDHVISLNNHLEFERTVDSHVVLKQGEKLWGEKPDLFDELGKKLHPDNLLTIVYTSGSTGVPKGVQLTHENLIHLAKYPNFGWVGGKDNYLSVLPLAHVFARQLNLIMITWGVSIYYLNELSVMAKVCRTIRPSLMIVVPRILEKIYSGIEGNLDKGGPIVRAIARWGFRLANKKKPCLIERWLLYPIANSLVFSQFRRALGGNWKVILCGGAALNPDIYQFLLNIGIPVYEGWGLTEASTAVVNQPGQVKVGTVGVPNPGVEIKIGKDEEVLVRGPTVMRGYYRNIEGTEAAIDEEGWLHTADTGVIDEEGFLTITGRLKEHFKLATGEWVAPIRMEEGLCRSPLVEMAVIIGPKKKYVTCLLYPDYNSVRRMKAKLDLEELSDDEFLESKVAQEEIQSIIDNVNLRVNNWAKIQRYRIVSKPMTVEAGELTPTLQVKREVVMKNNEALITEMYK